MSLDITKLTLGEVAIIEERSGLAISQIGDDDQPKGKALAALAFVASRRDGKPITWNEAMGLTFDEANEILGLNEDDEDEEAGEVPLGEGSPEPSESSSESPTPPQSESF